MYLFGVWRSVLGVLGSEFGVPFPNPRDLRRAMVDAMWRGVAHAYLLFPGAGLGKRAYPRNVYGSTESKRQRATLTTYPLVFSFQEPIMGNGFVAYVVTSGRVLLTEESEDSIWMFGVQPGGIAGGGRERSEAFRQFKMSYLSVLFDIANESSSYDGFESAARAFFSEVNAENEQTWIEAVKAVRAGKLSLPGLKSENADQWVAKIEVTRVDQQAHSSANVFDEIKEAA